MRTCMHAACACPPAAVPTESCIPHSTPNLQLKFREYKQALCFESFKLRTQLRCPASYPPSWWRA